MEDALVLNGNPNLSTLQSIVLILVLMEDALVRLCCSLLVKKVNRLNPCFNGRCTRTRCSVVLTGTAIRVLILVLMEDALVLFEFRLVYCLCFSVLILVLMEDALVPNSPSSINTLPTGLNPCFNGRCTRT